jgi:hypothetical protein
MEPKITELASEILWGGRRQCLICKDAYIHYGCGPPRKSNDDFHGDSMQERSVLSTFIDHYATKHRAEYAELLRRLEQGEQAPTPSVEETEPKTTKHSLTDRLRDFLYNEQPFQDP